MRTKAINEIRLIIKFVKRIFPEVNRELRFWVKRAEAITDKTLQTQALASIKHKRFHALGGSVYALYPKADLQSMVRFVVAFQTISDYLDNLCDRAGVEDEAAFRQLHLAMLDAVEPEKNFSDYYSFYPFQDDDGYLQSLVQICRAEIEKLPSYSLAAPIIKTYVKLYSELQTYKHLHLKEREMRLSSWAKSYGRDFPDIFWWEFAAATGSTLGIFLLVASAFNPSLTPEEVLQIDLVYFPWICGLHILLDYYIDADEDTREGDLNFTFYYEYASQCRNRLEFFITKSLNSCKNLPHSDFHATVIKGLLAMYLSDNKALTSQKKKCSLSLLNTPGPLVWLYHHWCRLLRIAKIL